MPPRDNDNTYVYEPPYIIASDIARSVESVRGRRAEPLRTPAPTYSPASLPDWSTVFSSWEDDSDDKENETEYIQEYNYIPKAFNFHKTNQSEEDLFLGAEIEVDCGGKNHDVAKEIIDILGDQNVYCKHDGSLDSGFEIVTHPATLYYHQSLDYKRAFSYLVKLGYRAHDVNTCGLHVHFNKSFFGKDKLHQDMNISKLLYIFEKFYQQVELIARRKHNDYAKRYYMEENETVFDMYSKAKSANKYGAINLKHDDTVEIRIFKGTLNYDTFMITLQFVRNIAKIVKRISIYDIQMVTWDSIYNKFSPELKKYYDDRTEQKKQEDLKKEEERKKREEERNREMAASFGLTNTRGERSTSTTRIQTISNNGEEPVYAYTAPSFSFDWASAIAPLEPLRVRNLDDVQRDVTDIRQRIRRSNNPMETLTFERQLNELDAEARSLRQSRTA